MSDNDSTNTSQFTCNDSADEDNIPCLRCLRVKHPILKYAGKWEGDDCEAVMDIVLAARGRWNQTGGVHAEDIHDIRILNEIRSRPMSFRLFAEFMDDYNAGVGGT